MQPMRKILELILAIEDLLEQCEPRTDAEAWLVRESANLVARLRGIVEALQPTE